MSQSDSSSAPARGNYANPGPHVVAITGGKGGVGKTSIAVNLAIALARLQHRVCLLDGDTGLANVNILLGLQPQYTLEHLLTGERSMQEILLPGPEGLAIIPGASGITRCAELNQPDQVSLINGLQQIEAAFDWLLVDTAAGISSVTINMIESAQVAALVITPEPTSLTDAFSLLKAMQRKGYQRRVLVIVNMVSSSDQPQAIFRRFQAAVRKYIGIEADYLGSVWMDESMRVAVASQKPVATLPTHDPSCRLFLRLADSLNSLFNERQVQPQLLSQYWRGVIATRQPQDSPAITSAAPAMPAASDAVDPAAPSIQAMVDYIDSASAIPADKALTLISALLEHAGPGEFSTSQISQIKRQVETRLATLEAIAPLPSAAAAPPAAQNPLPDHQPPGGQPLELQSAAPAYRRQISYDERRFGPQDHLARKIRSLDNNTSLDDFLRSL
ncbi:MinD/ParA family protein [Pseudomaricurvus alcaniphilus]|uniref:P-loop NTPase n=1 Tax=Pseudomaricurvus alcaniphilus TaxID=1166482 RepID=UPI00140C1B75|nr:P-loop NTPase [Pseudomaricurvus alcaniphilus]NHN39176.1 MinD/ParA family protein [Pseudomaricurvus alcaniphilus]